MFQVIVSTADILSILLRIPLNTNVTILCQFSFTGSQTLNDVLTLQKDNVKKAVSHVHVHVFYHLLYVKAFEKPE